MTQPIDTSQRAGARILVAEDDLVTRMVLKKMLEKAGYHADFANDGQEAIDALRQSEYDLVLMDCFMPRLDGFDATRMLRSSTSGDLNPRIPVIAMTGLTGEADRDRCVDAGMDDHIGKPVNTEELVAAIEKTLGKIPRVADVYKEQAGAAWDSEFLDSLIEKFVAEIPGVIDSLQLAQQGRDLPGLERIGHRLCGASDILEIHGLSGRSRALERAGKAGDIELAIQLATDLVSELQKMDSALKY